MQEKDGWSPADCFWFKFPSDPSAKPKTVGQAMQEALAKMEAQDKQAPL